MLPSASVVVPTYNHAHFLATALQTVLTQTVSVREVIVVDDGSTDNTAEVLAQFGGRIHTISQKNRGVAAARNVGAAAASGEILAFLDADDLWLPRKLECQLGYLRQDPSLGLVHCGVELIDIHGGSAGRLIDGMRGWVSHEMLLFRRAVILGGGSASVVPRSVFQKIGGFDESLSTSADWDLYYRIASTYRVGFVPEILVRYRIYDGSMHQNIHIMAKDMLRAYQKAFSGRDPELQKLQRHAYGNLHAVLAGSFLEKGGYRLGAYHVLKSMMFTPGKALHFAAYPVRVVRRRSSRMRSSARRQLCGPF